MVACAGAVSGRRPAGNWRHISRGAGRLTYPSFLGGVSWGGISVDPKRHLMVVNWNRMANYTQLISRDQANAEHITYARNGGTPHLGAINQQIGTPFTALTGPLLSPLQMPCTAPPFGKIAVVDLVRRRIIWQKPLGYTQDSVPLGYRSHAPLKLGVSEPRRLDDHTRRPRFHRRVASAPVSCIRYR